MKEARRRAKQSDGQDASLTLRLRELGGVIRAAGDLATLEKANYIEAPHFLEAVESIKPVEEQIRLRYGSYYSGVARDLTEAQRTGNSQYDYWQSHLNDDKMGYD